jgi:cation diffusion facilitator family transporter
MNESQASQAPGPTKREHEHDEQEHEHGAHEHDHGERGHGEYEHSDHGAHEPEHGERGHGERRHGERGHGEHEHGDHGAHEHDHGAASGVWGWIASALHLGGHSHRPQDLVADSSFAATSEGIRTVWLALAALGATSALQIVIVLWSGSVALLADTVHNIGDALNSIPLLIAFYLSRRAATRRYTYGFARAEDVAGVIIVLSIVVSAALVFWESFEKLFDPQPMANLGWVAAAALIGFVGNEAVAWLQIRTGRRIGSAALVADGQHARTDGFTSLAVLVAAAGSWLGFPLLDPIVGLVIGVAIVFIAKDATVAVWHRLMDAVDPELIARVERSAAGVAGVVAEVRHALFHDVPRLNDIAVHVDPCGHGGRQHHQLTARHERGGTA